MSDKRWLDELPLASAERELLLAGRSARPPRGSLDAQWKALSVALSAAPAAAASGAGAHAALHPVSGIVSKAGTSGLFSAATAKFFVVGVALGVGIAGAGAVVERMSREEPPRATEKPTLSPKITAPSEEPLRLAPSGGANPLPAPDSAVEKTRGTAAAREARGGSTPGPGAGAAPSASADPAADTSLAREARELAVVKRLLDAGSAAEALRRLGASGAPSGPSALPEERDALYVQALQQAGRKAEARVFARRFLERYPRSPYLGSMRRWAEE